MPPVPVSKSKPVLITFSILAGIQVLTAGATLADIIGETAFALIVLLAGAIQAGMSFYVSNQVTPYRDVVAKRNSQGRFVSGPAAPTGEGLFISVTDKEIHP
jgi:hypothetical protein